MGVKLSASTKRILRGEVARTPKIPGWRREYNRQSRSGLPTVQHEKGVTCRAVPAGIDSVGEAAQRIRERIRHIEKWGEAVEMKFLLYVETGFVGGRHEEEIEIDDEEYNDMTKEEQKKWLDESAQEFMYGCIEYGWEEVK